MQLLSYQLRSDVLVNSEMSMSVLNASDAVELGKTTYPSLGIGNSFAFKFEDHKGRVHRFNLGESYY